MSTGRVAVGVTGHQHRPGIDWAWTEVTLGKFLDRHPASEAISSLAVGADQLFARVALSRGIPLTTVLPFQGYEHWLAAADREPYLELLRASAKVVTLNGANDREEAFEAAGHHVALSSDVLIAIWDGQPAGSRGGTADIVDFARLHKRRVFWIDPLKRRSSTL